MTETEPDMLAGCVRKLSLIGSADVANGRHKPLILLAGAPEEIRTSDPQFVVRPRPCLKLVANQQFGLQALDLSR